MSGGAPSPFLDLAPELRNNIYDHVLETSKNRLRNSAFNITVTDGPLLSLLLVCKQINKEYQSRWTKWASLCIARKGNFWPCIQIPSALTTITKINIDVDLAALIWATGETEWASDWTSQLLVQLPLAESITLELAEWRWRNSLIANGPKLLRFCQDFCAQWNARILVYYHSPSGRRCLSHLGSEFCPITGQFKMAVEDEQQIKD